MFSSNPSESELLKDLLEPLLDDFQYWFGRSRSLLEGQKIHFLTVNQQSYLLDRVKQAQQEVTTTQLLVRATGGQVGIESKILMPWHNLVTECWQVAIRSRLESPRDIEPHS